MAKSTQSRSEYWVNHDTVLAQKNLRRRERYASDPAFREKRQKEAKLWRENNLERWNKRVVASYHKHRPRLLKERAAKRHGISLAFYESLVRVHGNKCAICSQPCPTKRSLAVDHDHKTGKVRGLLCQRCNHGLGLFHDNAERLREAANYLDCFYLSGW